MISDAVMGAVLTGADLSAQRSTCMPLRTPRGSVVNNFWSEKQKSFFNLAYVRLVAQVRMTTMTRPNSTFALTA